MMMIQSALLLLLLAPLSLGQSQQDGHSLLRASSQASQPQSSLQEERNLQDFDMSTISGPAFPSYTTDANCESVPGVMTVSFGYYQSWAKYRDADCHPVPADTIDANAYTHLAYSFAWINANYVLEPYNGSYDEEEANYAKFISLKQQNPDLMCLISVGGWTFSDPGPTQRRWTETVSSPENRATFVTSVLAFLRRYGFDGIELDWEFPGGGRGGQPTDPENYSQLVFDLRAAFDAAPEHYEVSMSVPVVRSLLDVGYDLPKLARGLDFMNLLTYDLHGVWEQQVGAHTDLVDIMRYLEYFVVDMGVPRHKIVLGLALYSRTYFMETADCVTFGCPFVGGGPGGCLDVHTLMPYYTVDDHITTGDYDTMDDYNPATGTSTLVFDERVLITYDSPTSLMVKAEYAKQSCFRGVMWWAVDMVRQPMVLPQLNLGGDSGIPVPVPTPVEAPTPAPPTPAPIEPPTAPPVEPPTAPPVEPPTLPPVEPPSMPPVEPPTLPPVEPPTSPPVESPTSPPVEPPTPVPVESPTPAPVEPTAPIPMFPVEPSAPTPPPTRQKIATESPSMVSQAPVAPPITPSPVPIVITTPAPVTKSPITSAPVTASPVTPAPVTKSPVTSAPVTASPVTPPPSSVPFPSTVPSDSPSAAPPIPTAPTPTVPFPTTSTAPSMQVPISASPSTVVPSMEPSSSNPTEQPTAFPWDASLVTGPVNSGAATSTSAVLTTTLMMMMMMAVMMIV